MSRLFPELEGGAAPVPVAAPAAAPVAAAPAAPAAPRAPTSGVRVRTLVGGDWSLQKYEQLLNLPGPFVTDNDGGCRIINAKAFQDAHLELDVAGGGVPVKTLWFWPKGRIPTPVGTGEDFDIGCKGDTSDARVQLLLMHLVRRLSKLKLQMLLKVLMLDAGKRIEEVAGAAVTTGGMAGETPDASGDPVDLLKSLVQVWGSSQAWYNFFADKEQQRNFCHNLTGSIVTIGHEDLECHYATPPVGDGTVSFFNYPRIHERYLAEGEDEVKSEEPGFTANNPGYMISDLHDLDIIKGGAKKLDRLLDTILAREQKPDMVIMRATCVPIVIGDDMEGSVERFKKKSSLPIIYLDNIADQFATPFRDTFRKVKDDPEFKDPVKRPGSINLLGFPKHAEMAGLIGFLKQLDITVNCRMLPEIDVKVMKRYRAAEVAVLFDTLLYDRTYSDVIGDIDLPTIRPMAPYGVAGTKRWLRTIAEAVGRADNFEATWESVYGEKEKQFEALKKSVAGYGLGFVVDSERILMLSEPRRLTGIPMIEMLDEMGFGLDFLFFAPSAAAESGSAALTELRAQGRRTAVFRERDELEQQLRAAHAQAFYSENFFDRRLTRSGKGQFSVNLIQMGVEGAIETLQQLLAVCRMPFYRKYAGYLGQPFPT